MCDICRSDRHQTGVSKIKFTASDVMFRTYRIILWHGGFLYELTSVSPSASEVDFSLQALQKPAAHSPDCDWMTVTRVCVCLPVHREENCITCQWQIISFISGTTRWPHSEAWDTGLWPTPWIWRCMNWSVKRKWNYCLKLTQRSQKSILLILEHTPRKKKWVKNRNIRHKYRINRNPHIHRRLSSTSQRVMSRSVSEQSEGCCLCSHHRPRVSYCQ